jgi:hypothetical protein
MGECMQPVQRQHKRTAAALLVLATGIAATTVTASSASAHTRHAARRPTQPTSSPPASAQVPCTPQSCALTPTTGMSSFNVQPVEVASGATPSFSIPAAANPGVGMLHSDGASGPFDCGGYHSKDPNAVQFFISNSFRGTLTYQVTDTVKNQQASGLQFCLGATFHFTTLSGNPAKSVTLPNGLQGFAGLLPSCLRFPAGPCVVSKAQAAAPNSKNAVLKLLIPAVGDPWGRA